MRRFSFVILALFAILALTTATAFGQTLGAVLTASQETPPTTTPGFGNATVTFDSTHQNITVTITVANLGSPINNFHIHENPFGVAGQVRVDLIGLGGTFNNGTMTGTFPIAADVASRMLANPANFYVNVHTTQFPGGAIRGQLAYVSGGPITYAADLRGANEAPPTGSNAFGGAFVTLDLVNNNIAWEVNSSGIGSATLSHIHRGAVGVAGPVIINFATTASQIAGGRTSGNATIASQQTSQLQASDLTNLATPAGALGYYVNLHSTVNPTGEIRGQLVPANEYDVPVAGRVVGTGGQTFVTDVRVFNPSYTSPTTALVEYFTAGAPSTGTANSSLVVNVPARGSAVLDDVGNTSALNVSGSTGGLRVSSAAQLNVTSRIYADLRSSGKGTLGQFVPAQSRGSALRRGAMPQLSNTSSTRTNVGFFNPNPAFATVRLELRDNTGALLGQNTLILPALSQQQNSIGTYFPGVDLSNAANVTLTFDASAPIFGYGAVNDSVSSDSSFVAAQSDSGTAANSQ
jgi:hypothetical protein